MLEYFKGNIILGSLDKSEFVASNTKTVIKVTK